MFHRFSGSARSIVFRARDIAQTEGRRFIDPTHILLALMERHPELFDGLSNHPIDLHSVQREVAEVKAAADPSRESARLRLDEQSKRALQVATREARSCWEQWEALRPGQILSEDRRYWEARLRQPIKTKGLPQWIMRWILRRKWEVDERHLLLGLLKVAEYPGVPILAKHGMTYGSARQRFCATRDANHGPEAGGPGPDDGSKPS